MSWKKIRKIDKISENKVLFKKNVVLKIFKMFLSHGKRVSQPRKPKKVVFCHENDYEKFFNIFWKI